MKLLRKVFDFADYSREQFIADFASTLKEGSSVLDAGAGPCKFRHLFSHCEYKAQDFAAYDGKDPHQYGKLDYISDINSIPVPDASFDCVICTEVLEHVPEPEHAVKELSRILKPNGLLLITAPLTSGIHMAPYHFFGGFTPYWYQRVSGLYGLRIERCEANGGFFKHYGQESRRFLYLTTPKSTLGRMVFFPFKVVLAAWFRVLVPLVCHFLDGHDNDKNFTVGYHVIARKSFVG